MKRGHRRRAAQRAQRQESEATEAGIDPLKQLEMLESGTCYQAIGVFGLYEEQELSGDTSRSCQGSPYYAPTDASSASCYGDISESVKSSEQTPPYAATDEGSQASADGSVVVGKGSAETEAGSDGVQCYSNATEYKQPDDKAPTDGSKTTSEGLSPITAAESSDAGAVSDCRRTTINGREVSINHFDIPAVGGEPVARYSESAGPVSILGAVDTPQPGSDLETDAITEQKKESPH